MHQTLLSLTACSSAQGHFWKTGQLAPSRRKREFLADVHIVFIADFKVSGAWVKVEHDLHRNVWKMGMVHRKNVPRKYPTGIPHSLGIKMNQSNGWCYAPTNLWGLEACSPQLLAFLIRFDSMAKWSKIWALDLITSGNTGPLLISHYSGAGETQT